MRILMTADAAGGVGIFAAELAAALERRGHHVLQVIFSPQQPPAPEGVGEFVWAPFRLEWMDNNGDDRALATDAHRGRAFLADLARRWHPDLLHSNQFAYVAAIEGIPTLLTVHSDVISWWRTVHGSLPPDNAYQRWYRILAEQALACAHAITTPSHAARQDLLTSFGCSSPVRVIHNGRTPAAFSPATKLPRAVAAGRLWDRGKQLALLGALPSPLPLELVWAGEARNPVLPTPTAPPPGVRICGPLSPPAMSRLLAAARAFVGTSLYEPFGLAALEAALAGCILLLNNIPSWRELWATVAQFYSTPAQLLLLLQRVADDPRWAEEQGRLAQRFARRHYNAQRMASQYEALAGSLV